MGPDGLPGWVVKDYVATGTVSVTDICFLGEHFNEDLTWTENTPQRQLKQEEQLPSQPP